jgi:hypothetical protein
MIAHCAVLADPHTNSEISSCSASLSFLDILVDLYSDIIRYLPISGSFGWIHVEAISSVVL